MEQPAGVPSGKKEMAGVQKAASALTWSERMKVLTGPAPLMMR